MAKEFLFKHLLPTVGFFSCLYFIFGNWESVYIGLVIGWTIVVSLIIIGLKNKWFE